MSTITNMSNMDTMDNMHKHEQHQQQREQHEVNLRLAEDREKGPQHARRRTFRRVGHVDLRPPR